jgi:hypothetical protein
LDGAIAIAERIPSYTEAHAEAQRLIRDWDAQLNPPPPPEPDLQRKFDEGIPIDWDGSVIDNSLDE